MYVHSTHLPSHHLSGVQYYLRGYLYLYQVRCNVHNNTHTHAHLYIQLLCTANIIGNDIPLRNNVIIITIYIVYSCTVQLHAYTKNGVYTYCRVCGYGGITSAHLRTIPDCATRAFNRGNKESSPVEQEA